VAEDREHIVSRQFFFRDEAEIKTPKLCRIFVCSFCDHVGCLVSYVTDVAVENTDKKTS